MLVPFVGELQELDARPDRASACFELFVAYERVRGEEPRDDPLDRALGARVARRCASRCAKPLFALHDAVRARRARHARSSWSANPRRARALAASLVAHARREPAARAARPGRARSRSCAARGCARLVRARCCARRRAARPPRVVTAIAAFRRRQPARRARARGRRELPGRARAGCRARCAAHLLAIYGFARLIDDARRRGAGDRSALLDALEARSRARLRGRRAPSAARSGSRRRCARARCPREPFARLIEANRRDQRVARATRRWDELRDYCALSADPVGELVLHVFGAATPERIALSDAICTALQVARALPGRRRGSRAPGASTCPPSDPRARAARATRDLDAPPASPAAAALRCGVEVARARALLARGRAARAPRCAAPRASRSRASRPAGTPRSTALERASTSTCSAARRASRRDARRSRPPRARGDRCGAAPPGRAR